MAIKGNALIDSSTNRLLASQQSAAAFDVIVGATNSDYTLPSSAYNAGGSGKSYLVKAGTYNETTNVIPPANSYTYFESQNGGVVIDNSGGGTFTTGASFLVTDSISTIGNNLVTLGGAPDISAVVSTPSNYRYWNKGQSYGISSANNTTKVLTLDRNVVNPDGGATNYSAVVYLPVRGVVMAGQLTLQNTSDYYPLFGFDTGDWSGLKLTANKQITLTAVGMDLGQLSVKQNTYTSSRTRGIYSLNSSGLTGKMIVKGCSGSVAGPTYSVLWLNCEDLAIELDVTGNINTDGGQTNIGLDGSGTRGSVAWGVCTNNETNTANVTNVNTAALRTT